MTTRRRPSRGGLSIVGLSGVGLSGVGLSGVGLSGVGLSGVGLSGVGLSVVGLSVVGLSVVDSGAGPTAEKLGRRGWFSTPCRKLCELFSVSDEAQSAIRHGLAALGTRRLVLAIHDGSFPSATDEDFGRGSPYGQGGRRLLALARQLGFGGVQLGPQGDTTLSNPSPYDGALLSKNPLSIALATLAEDPRWAPLCRGLLAPLVARRPDGPADRTQYAYAWNAARRTLGSLHQRFRDGEGDAARAPLAARFAAFRRRQQATLQADADYQALTAEHGTDDWRRWPDAAAGGVDQDLHAPGPALVAAARRRREALRVTRARDIDQHLFGQFVLAEQHRQLRRALAGDGAGASAFLLYGDLQIGFSHRDIWSRRGLFRADYLMGAPPSRTNPEGQPWGYPVLDPLQYETAGAQDGAPGAPGAPGAAMQLLMTRVDRMLDDCDGIRVDHPHGLVCPWVYAAGDPDPAAAVPRGARLRCSPNLADHAPLAPLAIPRPDQLSRDPGIARYADDWVQRLDDDQVRRYGVLFDAVMARVASAGRQQADVVCEVLSTWPFPLRAVMLRYGLGRFCVTQKADLARADDVYRSDNASERDWIMVGNHDTPPIWLLAEGWHATAAGGERAAYLAARLMPARDPALRARFARWIGADARHLCQAMFADLFAGRARHVSVFFADLFGARDVYNRPGVVDAANWTLRLPSRFDELYAERLRAGRALNVPLALSLALVGRAEATQAADRAAIARRLLNAAREMAPALDGEIVSIVEDALASA
jgi:4-alpha-glucanotransferase